MKILFDHQAFELQRWGGISRYFVELISGLAGRVEVDLSLARSMNEYVPTLERLLGIRVTDRGFYETFLRGSRFRWKKQLRSIAKRVDRSLDARRVNLRASLERLDTRSFDLFHPTYYEPYFLEALRGRPFVLTVFDLTHEVLADHFPPRDAVPGWKRAVTRAATRILAISENTKRDLVRLLDVDPDGVDVVPLGFDPPASPGAPPTSLPGRYVLFTGTRVSYKNWAFCVRALAPLLRDTRDLHLVCTGDPFSAAERAFLAEERVADRVRHVSVGEGGMPALYGRAAAFVFPSLYEGFGLPVLDAFAAGCPVAVATGSSLPEVAGEAALSFDPRNADEIRGAVERLLRDAGLRARLVERGRARLRSFTWDKTCEETLRTYERALGEPRRRASVGR
jgi:glycosyltransferase involved in cell wall biosynthesis